MHGSVNKQYLSRKLHHSVVTKRELSTTPKLLVFKSVVVPSSPMFMNLG